MLAQPLPSVEPALLFADLLDESEDRVRPAFDSAAFDGLLMLLTSSRRSKGDAKHRQNRSVRSNDRCASRRLPPLLIAGAPVSGR